MTQGEEDGFIRPHFALFDWLITQKYPIKTPSIAEFKSKLTTVVERQRNIHITNVYVMYGWSFLFLRHAERSYDIGDEDEWNRAVGSACFRKARWFHHPKENTSITDSFVAVATHTGNIIQVDRRRSVTLFNILGRSLTKTWQSIIQTSRERQTSWSVMVDRHFFMHSWLLVICMKLLEIIW